MDLTHARALALSVDARKLPAQLNGSRQFAVLLIDGADCGSISIGDEKHAATGGRGLQAELRDMKTSPKQGSPHDLYEIRTLSRIEATQRPFANERLRNATN
jgi:hypothetical protein